MFYSERRIVQKTIIKAIQYLLITVFFLGVVGGASYYYRIFSRPKQINLTENLFQGVRYHRIVKINPRIMIIHIVEIDVKQKGIKFLVSPPGNPKSLDINARKTSTFLEENHLQIAINGSFFTPFHSHGPFDYYPHEGDSVDVLGLAISSSKTYSSDYPDWAVFCVNDNQVHISQVGCLQNTQQAIAGKQLLLKQGVNNIKHLTAGYAISPQPRSAVAINKDKTKVWFVVVDGRQKKYSEGISLNELAELLISLGAYDAINLDGGGSSTLVRESAGKSSLLNAPLHTKIPMNERPVANHLGVYALPVLAQ